MCVSSPIHIYIINIGSSLFFLLLLLIYSSRVLAYIVYNNMYD